MISSAQLSLFDTTAVIKPTYKVGDLVRLRKKPMAASYVKKGDFVVVAAIHPVDGSVKFWNERSECWEFVQHDEISSIIPKAHIVDTESIASPVDDSVSSKAQIADTEYTAETGVNDDSVSSKAQIADTEYTAETGVNDDSVSSKAISIYSPRGTARSGEYFRFSYREGSRMRHIHIRGGNTDSPIAQAKVQEVRSLLASGVSPAEIAAMLKAPKP
jgi:hypothetical protein